MSHVTWRRVNLEKKKPPPNQPKHLDLNSVSNRDLSDLIELDLLKRRILMRKSSLQEWFDLTLSVPTIIYPRGQGWPGGSTVAGTSLSPKWHSNAAGACVGTGRGS